MLPSLIYLLEGLPVSGTFYYYRTTLYLLLFYFSLLFFFSFSFLIFLCYSSSHSLSLLSLAVQVRTHDSNPQHCHSPSKTQNFLYEPVLTSLRSLLTCLKQVIMTHSLNHSIIEVNSFIQAVGIRYNPYNR